MHIRVFVGRLTTSRTVNGRDEVCISYSLSLDSFNSTTIDHLLYDAVVG
jgi:hypothetical protein